MENVELLAQGEWGGTINGRCVGYWITCPSNSSDTGVDIDINF